jgi:hypothetical protein
MPNNISPELLAQLYAQESDDVLLFLVTLSHQSFSDIRLVNNTENIVSNGNTYQAFPMDITLPTDDGETERQLQIEFDNVSLDLIDEIRSVTDPIQVKIELVLASNPNFIQYSYEELQIRTVGYNKFRIQAKLYMDSFLNVELTSEKYVPSLYPGLF